MADAYDRLGFVKSRLVRHGAEREHVAVPPVDAPGTGILLFAGDRVILRPGETPTALLTPDEAARRPDGPLTIFLGRFEDRPVFATALPEDAAESFPEPDFRISDLRGIAAQGAVAAEELGLLATAKSVLAWHGRNGFCSNCGTATEPKAGGFRRECPACGMHHFPRTDPVVIMLVHRGDACLIGRGPHFPGTMYSCLAGFVEPGETIEDAVRRETFEETGIAVGSVRYRASQPWPFPSSLMIGCVAEATTEVITRDPLELAEARWVSRAELRTMFDACHPEGITAPQPLAIAHLLLRDFLDGTV
ncbi:NAD(+) diphosphatase [Methylobacterium haplocladii]|uniref:NAD(+) diphosphatase n=1 Tax=Methylobacterium haplocladii TaxID=1176176 RepID=A0A512IN91_9HYPH|nr:NAD(+) diphosphatase [Methylobacterium haplocladii]GEO99176.1 NADH pyrophosphatase [Methylobacterium haplocladii]GJD83180.1 NADH pyrophosphatase [Methylobacterium haplocladii]GLS58500.1 NADH pyrophosphatase [Methylobacterium haplocladii]